MAIKAVVDKLDDVPEQFRELYVERNGKFEINGVEGMRTEADVTRLSTALERERNEHKGTKEKYKGLGDRKVEDVLTELDLIPSLRAAAEGKFDDNKVNELVEKRLGTKTAPLTRQIETLGAQLLERDTTIESYKAKETLRSIHDSVREAIGKAQGFQSVALEDALMFAERHLTVGEDGKVVTKEGVGVTPGVDAVVWLSEMQNRKHHWWGQTAGGGASGGKGNNMSGIKNPFSHEHWNMTEQGKLVRENRTRADQLAASAGTVVGGRRPAPRAGK